MSLKERLARYLRDNHGWIPKGEICDLAREKTGATGEHRPPTSRTYRRGNTRSAVSQRSCVLPAGTEGTGTFLTYRNRRSVGPWMTLFVPGYFLRSSPTSRSRSAHSSSTLASIRASNSSADLVGIVVDQGETKGVLVQRLKNLADRGVLLPTLAAWSKEVRMLGNDAVHDLTVDVSMDDASQLVEFIRELAHGPLWRQLARRRCSVLRFWPTIFRRS
jgi:hypothetical protein